MFFFLVFAHHHERAMTEHNCNLIWHKENAQRTQEARQTYNRVIIESS